MTVIRHIMAALTGGVSRQPTEARADDTLDEAINTRSRYGFGVEKRPPSKILTPVCDNTLANATTGRLRAMRTDDGTLYLIVLGSAGGGIEIHEYGVGRCGLTITTAAASYISGFADGGLELTDLGGAEALIINRDKAVARIDAEAFSVDPANVFTDVNRMVRRVPEQGVYCQTTQDGDAGVDDFAAGWNSGEGTEPGFFFYSGSGVDGQTFAQATMDAQTGDFARPRGEYDQLDGRSTGGARIHYQRRLVTNTGVSWTAGTRKLNKTGAFANVNLATLKDNFIQITGGTGFAAGWYRIAAKDSDDQIELDATPGYPGSSLGGSDTADVAIGGVGGIYQFNLPNYTGDYPGAASMDEIARDILKKPAAANLGRGLIDDGAPPTIRVEWIATGTTAGYFRVTSPWTGTDSKLFEPLAPLATAFGSTYDYSANAFNVTTAGTQLVDGGGSLNAAEIAIVDRWERVASPGDEAARFDPTTMPCRLTRTAAGGASGPAQFTLDVAPWEPRRFGDADNNPGPDGLAGGAKIRDAVVHRNRLALLAGHYVVFSELNEFYNLFQVTVASVEDTDPLELDLAGEGVGRALRFGEHRGNLVVTTDGDAQFQIGRPAVLTPKTAFYKLATRYTTPDVRPVSNGRGLLLPTLGDGTTQGAVGLREYVFDLRTDTEDAEPLSEHVPEWMPAVIRSMAACPMTGQSFILAAPNLSLFVHQNTWQGGRRVQSAWERWTFGRYLLDTLVDGTTLFLLTTSSDGTVPLIEAVPLGAASSSGVPPTLPAPTTCSDDPVIDPDDPEWYEKYTACDGVSDDVYIAAEFVCPSGTTREAVLYDGDCYARSNDGVKYIKNGTGPVSGFTEAPVSATHLEGDGDATGVDCSPEDCCDPLCVADPCSDSCSPCSTGGSAVDYTRVATGGFECKDNGVYGTDWDINTVNAAVCIGQAQVNMMNEADLKAELALLTLDVPTGNQCAHYAQPLGKRDNLTDINIPAVRMFACFDSGETIDLLAVAYLRAVRLFDPNDYPEGVECSSESVWVASNNPWIGFYNDICFDVEAQCCGIPCTGIDCVDYDENICP